MIKLFVSNLNSDLKRELNEYIGISQEDRMKKCRVIHNIKQRFLNSDIYRLKQSIKLQNIYVVETFEEHWFGDIQNEEYYNKGIIFGKVSKNPSGISHFDFWIYLQGESLQSLLCIPHTSC